MSAFLAKYLGRWSVCIVFALIATLMFTILVPQGVAVVTTNRTVWPRVLDEYYLTWSADDARHLYSALGVAGRRAYQAFYLKLDFWFPCLSLSIFYAALLSLAFPQGRRFGWLNLTAVALYLADLAENLNHFAMASSFPNLPTIQLAVGPYLSLAKYLLITGLPLIAVIGFVVNRKATKIAGGH